MKLLIDKTVFYSGNHRNLNTSQCYRIDKMGRYSKIDIAINEVNGKSISTQRRFLCGDLLDYGLYRDVYISKHDPRYVIKIERDMSTGNFANVCEWRNWVNNIDWLELSKWLARSYLITENGQLLVQQRVHFYNNREYPNKIPSLFTDLKKSNYGWIGNQLKCCDYSFILMNNHSLKLKKAKWWSLN